MREISSVLDRLELLGLAMDGIIARQDADTEMHLLRNVVSEIYEQLSSVMPNQCR